MDAACTEPAVSSDVHDKPEQIRPQDTADAVSDGQPASSTDTSTKSATEPPAVMCQHEEQHQQGKQQYLAMQEQQHQQQQLVQDTMQEQQANSPQSHQEQQCRSPQSSPIHKPVGSRAGSPCGISLSKHEHLSNKLRQRAARCIEKHEQRLILELQAVITQTAFSTAAGAAAGAAFGAGAAVTAAEQALEGRLLHTSGRLLSPPDSARTRSVQPAAVQQLRQHVSQLQAQLEAAEAKLHVHRTAASTAKDKITRLERLVQQLQRKHSQQAQQIAAQQKDTQLQSQQVNKQQQQLLLQEQTMRQQQQTIQQQQQKLTLMEQQLEETKAKLQHDELESWKQLVAHASLEEQELRQQQQLLQQEQAQHLVQVQQLAWREQQLELQQEQVQEQLQQQLEHLQQQLNQQQALRTASMELELQQKQLQEQQQQLEQERQEVERMMQQVEQERQDLAAHVQRLDVKQQVGALQQAAQGVDNQQEPCAGHGANVQDNAGAAVQEPEDADGLQSLPKLPVLTGLLQRVAQTLASPSSIGTVHSPAAGPAAPASSTHTSSSPRGRGRGVVAADNAELNCTPAVHEVSTHESWSSALSSSTTALSEESTPEVPAVVAAAATEPERPEKQQQQQQEEQDREQHQEQQQQQQQQPRQRQQVPPLPNLEKLQGASDSWQLIPSPSSMPPADQHQYHASAFSRVLEQVASTNLDAVQSPPAGLSHQQVYQVQQEELSRLAEYLKALVADNTVLCCEVFHLQRLLADQHRVNSHICQAISHKIAAQAEPLLDQMQHAELLQELQQVLHEAALGAGGSEDLVEVVCAAVREQLPPLLAEHTGCIRDLLLELDDQVAACLAEVEGTEEAVSTADIEEQLSAFELAYEEVHSENGAVVPHQHGTNSRTAASPGPGSYPDLQHKPGVARPFVTSPSGHVSLLPSRRTSAAQQTAAAPAGAPATGPTAAALNKRRSRLADLFGGGARAAAAAEAGGDEEPSGSAAGPAAGPGRREKGRVYRLVSLFSGSTRSSFEAPVEHLSPDGRVEQQGFTTQAPQQKPAECLQQQSEVQHDQQQQDQQQGQQPGGGDSPESRRKRGATLAMLGEVVERLQGATGRSSPTAADRSPPGGDSRHQGNTAVAGPAAAARHDPACDASAAQGEHDPSSGCEAADSTCCVATAFSCAVELQQGVDEQKQQLQVPVPVMRADDVEAAKTAEQLLMQVVQDAAMAVVSTRQQRTGKANLG